MKKVACIFFSVFAVMATASCVSENNSWKGISPTKNPLQYGGTPDSRYETTAWRTETEGEYLLGGYDHEFEMRGLRYVHPATSFGKVEIDRETFTKGTGSLKMTVEGSGMLYSDNQELPIITMSTVDSTTVGASYRYDMLTDYTEYDKVSFDLYSEQNNACVFFYVNVDVNNKSHYYIVEASKGWNTVEIPLSYEKFFEGDGTSTFADVWNFGFGFTKYQNVGAIQTYRIDNFRMIKE